MSAAAPPLKAYELWPGNNFFFCDGHIITGPDVNSAMFTPFLIVIPVVVYFIWVCPDLWYHVHPAVVIVGATLAAMSLGSFMLTAFRDPGILPRRTEPDWEEVEVVQRELRERIGAQRTNSLSSSSRYLNHNFMRSRIPRSRDVEVNGMLVKIKWCDTCNLYRPPRCSHCSICNNCVERFDHHCPWVGQCIGRRNYGQFLTFVLSTTVLAWYVFATSIVHMDNVAVRGAANGEPDDWAHLTGYAFRSAPASVFLMFYTFLMVWFVFGLGVFHLYLVSINQTTYENFKFRYDDDNNPYHVGCGSNFAEVCCSMVPESKLRLREPIPDPDIRSKQFGMTSSDEDEDGGDASPDPMSSPRDEGADVESGMDSDAVSPGSISLVEGTSS